MKLATFERAGEARVGVVLDSDRIVDLAAAGGTSKGLPESMLALLDTGEDALATARELAANAPADAILPLNAVKIQAPILYPRKLFCLAGNYSAHIRESGKSFAKHDRITPRVFMKPPTTTVIADGDPILIPPVGQQIDWEAELGVVIGRRGKEISEEEALHYVAGYTVFHDVSERALKIRERDQSGEWDKFFDWLNGKWMDTFAPMGPWIVTADDIPDPQQLDISLTVNGQTMQHANTGQMIFSVAYIISYISQIITLEPGDVIATGTPEGVGMGRGIFLKPGDRVRVSIERIGDLENPVAAE